MKGMTGYGRALEVGDSTAIEVVVSSFNKRSLDVVLKLPQELLELDPFIRKSVSDCFERGAITVSVKEVGSLVHKDKTLVTAEQRFQRLKKITAHLGLTLTDGEIFTSIVEATKESLIAYEKDETEQKEKIVLAKGALAKALCEVQVSRSKEGVFLREDLTSRLDILASLRDHILLEKGDVVSQQIARLKALLEPYLASPVSADERLLKEVVFFADRMDISEEVSRIGHHIELCRKVFSEEGSLGKKVDFILQELMREFNTLGAKTSNVAITVHVVHAKTELEKMREQVQNVE